jgi:Holliday junction DNA helicase RuvB
MFFRKRIVHDHVCYDPNARDRVGVSNEAFNFVAGFRPAAVAAPESEFTPTELTFKPGEPNVLFQEQNGIEFVGNELQKKRLFIKTHALRFEERFKSLFVGTAGTGKTSLAWIVAKMIQERQQGGRLIEILSSQLGTLDQLADFCRQLEAGDIVFIDEIHTVASTIGVEPLLHVLADTGHPRLKYKGSEIRLPSPVHWIGATTDLGQMDKTTGGALRRRFDPIIRLEAPNVDQLVDMIASRGATDMPIDRAAAYELAERSNGLPWQALSLYWESCQYARFDGAVEVTMSHALDALTTMELDANGMGPDDRAIMTVLLASPVTMANGEVKYRMAQSGLCAASGVDPEIYRIQVQPKLMRRGFLNTMGGQCLTPKAVAEYGHLAEEEDA